MPPPTYERFREEEEASEFWRVQRALVFSAASLATPRMPLRCMPMSASSRSLNAPSSFMVVRYTRCLASCYGQGDWRDRDIR